MIVPQNPLSDEEANLTRLSSANLKLLTPLLRLDAVRAGDVLLTRGRKLESQAVAWLSGGEYSHAAIWLPHLDQDGRSMGSEWHRLQLVESDDFGVGPTTLRTIHLYLDGKTHEVAAMLPGEPERAILLRHPDIDNATNAALALATSNFGDGEMWRRYPSLDRLVGASALGPAAKSLLAVSLSAVFATTRQVAAPGSFCSELVAKFFHHLSLHLFGAHIDPENISPNHLVGKECVLAPVCDAIVTAAHIGEQSYAEPMRFEFAAALERKEWVPSLVKRNEEAAHSSELVSSLHRMATNFRQQQTTKVQRLYGEEDANIEKLLRNVRPFETPKQRSTCHSLFALSVFSRNLDSSLAPLEALDSNLPPLEAEDSVMEEHLSRFYAVLWLRQEHTRIRSKLTEAFYRHQLAYLLYLGRKLPGSLEKKTRAKFLKAWQEFHASPDPFADSMLGPWRK